MITQIQTNAHAAQGAYRRKAFDTDVVTALVVQENIGRSKYLVPCGKK